MSSKDDKALCDNLRASLDSLIRLAILWYGAFIVSSLNIIILLTLSRVKLINSILHIEHYWNN